MPHDGLVVANGTTGRSTKQAMVAREVTGDTADGGTGQAADSRCITRGCDGAHRDQGGEGEDRLHEVSPTVVGLLRL
jgi:hypothetical protein